MTELAIETPFHTVALPPITFQPSPNFSSRRGSPIDLIVFHETAGSYRGAISWLRTPTVYGPDGRVLSGPDASAHFVVREDGGEATQLVALTEKAWTQARWNPSCISIELANITAKGYATDAQLRVGARIAAWLLHLYAIPPRWARHGLGRGVTYHGDLPDSGGHPNCGPDPTGWQRLLELIGDELDIGGFRHTWAKVA